MSGERKPPAVVVVSRPELDPVATGAAAAVSNPTGAVGSVNRLLAVDLALARVETPGASMRPAQAHRRPADASKRVSHHSASIIASCITGLMRAIALLSGVGCTRLVSSAT